MTQPIIVGSIIGGQPKKRYWTPDGREITAQPNTHGTSDGGIRDANLDKGWLASKPTELKLYCPHCDMWHDTKDEVAKCGAKKKAIENKYKREAKKTIGKEVADKDKEIENLRAEMAEIKDLLNKMVAKGVK